MQNNNTTRITTVLSGDTSIREFVERTQREIWRKGKDNHRHRMMSKINLFFDYMLPHRDIGLTPIKDINFLDISDFLNFIEDNQDITISTHNKYSSALSAVFKYAVQARVISQKPLITWKQIETRDPTFFTEEQISKMMRYFSDEYEVMTHFLTIGLTTGMRLGEILSVGTTGIIQCIDNVNFVRLTKTKSGKPRDVPLCKEAYTALEALDFKPANHFKHGSFYWFWGKMRRDIMFDDPSCRFHVSRHTAATIMANDLGMNIVLIAKQLGHSSIKTTMKYVHLKDKTLVTSSQRLGNYITNSLVA